MWTSAKKPAGRKDIGANGKAVYRLPLYILRAVTMRMLQVSSTSLCSLIGTNLLRCCCLLPVEVGVLFLVIDTRFAELKNSSVVRILPAPTCRKDGSKSNFTLIADLAAHCWTCLGVPISLCIIDRSAHVLLD